VKVSAPTRSLAKGDGTLWAFRTALAPAGWSHVPASVPSSAVIGFQRDQGVTITRNPRLLNPVAASHVPALANRIL
jgi:hypothetical protein